jgi:hypothetical protein
MMLEVTAMRLMIICKIPPVLGRLAWQNNVIANSGTFTLIRPQLYYPALPLS